jgi:hypothetical protein
MITQIGSRFVNLTWQAPLTSNGFIAEYKIYINDIFTQTVSIIVACLFKIFVKPTGTYRNINPWDKSLMSLSVHYTIQITVI